MLEIKGKYATAICYARVIEDEAIAQIRRMCDWELTQGSRVRIMPDVHAGAGCTIGTTMTVTDKICPNGVGVDSGRGMYTVKLASRLTDLAQIDEAAHRVPSGLNVWDTPREAFDLSALKCFRALRDVPRLGCSLGTLGGGNHFIEIDQASDGTCYLVIHSGSRNLGKQVAQFYQEKAICLHSGKEEYYKRRCDLISAYKAQGRQRELQTAIQALALEYHTVNIPEELCWLYGDALADYLADIELCQRFARRSRELMAETILRHCSLEAAEAFHTVHNYIDTDEMILRKGAIAAHQGEKVLIPINMRDGSVLAVGKGDPDWNFSAPHGAGRLMSRGRARAVLTLDEYRAAMDGIYSTSVNESTIDEAPMAYKSLSDIVDMIHDTVEVIEILKPVYNFKAAEEEAPWSREKRLHRRST